MIPAKLKHYHSRMQIAAFCKYLAAYPAPMQDAEVVGRAWKHAKRIADMGVTVAMEYVKRNPT